MKNKFKLLVAACLLTQAHAPIVPNHGFTLLQFTNRSFIDTDDSDISMLKMIGGANLKINSNKKTIKPKISESADKLILDPLNVTMDPQGPPSSESADNATDSDESTDNTNNNDANSLRNQLILYSLKLTRK